MSSKHRLKPIKRHVRLQPLSRANHQGLMFCLLLEKGLRKEVAFKRMLDFLRHFYGSYWKMHRERVHLIVKELLPGEDSVHVAYLKQYQSLTDKWAHAHASETVAVLEDLKDSLRAFIRWQERTLFMHLQAYHEEKVESLDLPEAGDDVCTIWSDPFWE